MEFINLFENPLTEIETYLLDYFRGLPNEEKEEFLDNLYSNVCNRKLEQS